VEEFHGVISRSIRATQKAAFQGLFLAKNLLLRGIKVAMYIVGQERRLVDPPSQVVAGVRTVTTQMDERCDAHVAALIPLLGAHHVLWPPPPAN
jgi:hypothetical protein